MEKSDLNVTREVILDLLPLYLAGEASPATRALVEDFMSRDAELTQKIRLQWSENFSKLAPSALPPELELRSLRRARTLIGWQRWLFGLGIFFSACALSFKITFDDGHLTEAHFVLIDYPLELGSCLLVGAACWAGYFYIRRRIRVT